MRALARRLRCCPYSFRFFFSILRDIDAIRVSVYFFLLFFFIFRYIYMYIYVYVYVYLSFCFEYPDASDWTEDVRRSRDIYYTNIWYYVIISPP